MELNFAFKYTTVLLPPAKAKYVTGFLLLNLIYALSINAVSAAPVTPAKQKSLVKPHVASLKNGEKLYTELSCAMCHPAGGNSSAPEKPIKGDGFMKRFPDNAVLAAFIRQGRLEKGMPAFGKDVINDQNLADLIGYIRSFSLPEQKNVVSSMLRTTTLSKKKPKP